MASPDFRSRLAWVLPLGAGLGFSAAMLLAGPPLGWWPFSFAAVVPLAWCASRPGARPWRDGALAAVGAVPLWAVTQAWVRDVSVMGYIPLVLALAVCVGAFVTLVSCVGRLAPRAKLITVVPVLWTALEFLRGEILCGGYAWGFVAHPLIDRPAAVIVASWGGVYLVTFWTAMMAGQAIDLVREHDWRRPIAWLRAAGLVLFIAALLAPDFRRPPALSGVRLAVVQTNVPQSNKIAWTIEQEAAALERFEQLTREAAATTPACIIWPETMMPGLSLEPSALEALRAAGLFYRVPGPTGEREINADEFAARLFALSRDVGVPMLVGEEAWEGFRVDDGPEGLAFLKDHRYNSVYLVVHGELAPVRYDKMHLTPFGEEMPYVRHWPWLQRQLLDLAATGMAFDLSVGTRRTVFTVPGERPIRAVTPICFEITSSSVCRSLAYDGRTPRADIIVNLTNDGWFGESDLGRAQHLQIARWRAAELGLPVVRAANTGVSAIIDPRGRVVASGTDAAPGASLVDGVLSGELPAPRTPTVYARVGNVAGWVCLVWAGLLVLLAGLQARASRRTSPRPAA